MNEQNVIDEYIKCIATDKSDYILIVFFVCKRLFNVNNNVCECYLFKHRNQKCLINKQSIMMSISQTFTRSHVFVTFDARNDTRLTTKTFELQINITFYLLVRSNKQNNSTTIKLSTIENSLFTFVYFYKSLFFDSKKNNFSIRIQLSTTLIEKNATMKLNQSIRSNTLIKQKFRNNNVFVRVITNSKKKQNVQKKYREQSFSKIEYKIVKTNFDFFLM